jgi:hypothetical protein
MCVQCFAWLLYSSSQGHVLAYLTARYSMSTLNVRVGPVVTSCMQNRQRALLLMKS